jgi:hypothetical protein
MTSDRNVQKNTTGKPRPVPDDVREKQDPEYTEDEFDAALDSATKRLEGLAPSERDPGSPRR